MMSSIAATVIGPSGEAGSITVRVERAAACKRCAAGKGCGAGLFQRGTADATLDIRLPSENMDLQPGEQIELALAPRRLLEAALTVYGLPLAGAGCFVLVAHMSELGDAGSVVAALAGLFAGLFVGRARLRRSGCLDRMTPEIVARAGASF